MKKIPVWPAHTVSWLKIARFKDGSVRWIGDLKLLEPLLAQLKAEAELREAKEARGSGAEGELDEH